jgi:RNA polymerase sigma-70 factor (ECF subfamily)
MIDTMQTNTLQSIPQLDDETLLKLICSQDESALSSLYERYARLLYSIALRITNDRAAAEEVLQDVFHSVWHRATTFRPSAGSVSAWLSGIARNRAIDEVRSRWHRAREREIPLDYLPDWSGAVERGLEQFTVLRADLRHALSALPSLQRQAIELAYFGGFSSSEIAAQLNEPIGTIKGRLRLGMEKLRQTLATFMEADEELSLPAE